MKNSIKSTTTTRTRIVFNHVNNISENEKIEIITTELEPQNFESKIHFDHLERININVRSRALSQAINHVAKQNTIESYINRYGKTWGCVFFVRNNPGVDSLLELVHSSNI